MCQALLGFSCRNNLWADCDKNVMKYWTPTPSGLCYWWFLSCFPAICSQNWLQMAGNRCKCHVPVTSQTSKEPSGNTYKCMCTQRNWLLYYSISTGPISFKFSGYILGITSNQARGLLKMCMIPFNGFFYLLPTYNARTRWTGWCTQGAS